jgi:hypothetical protein
MVDMALGESRGHVAQDQIDGRLAAWPRQGPAGCLTPLELMIQAVFFHEGNQACGLAYSVWLDVVPAPQGILAVKVSADYEMASSIGIRGVLRNRRV